ncbi:hypothetical protein B0H13DRAFT_1858124 [Mycena leptocephala]|nr:hypothetical protein B0H13DRAFT_1858124 [Mycena leptocephala]
MCKISVQTKWDREGAKTVRFAIPFVHGSFFQVLTLLRVNFSSLSSKECHRENWKHHKELAATQEKIHMSLTDPDGTKRAADWKLWCHSTDHDASKFGLLHALGLHRNPERGRTHIVFKVVELLWDWRSPGEGQEYVDSLLDELEETSKVPFIDLSFGEGVTAWLGSNG